MSQASFTGLAPSTLGNLSNLEYLDLGPIPPSMSSMTFLNYLNLSHNNLSGSIPSSNQFQTFNDPSIYEGNAYLYGLPLTSNCSAADLGDAKDKNDEASSEKFWLYVGTAMGFIIGFWSICGTLINKRSWRRAYFMFLDETKDRLYVIIAVSVARFKRMAALARI
ncbi:hypothetical protein ACOSQ3_018889 [Xanthoceras sorbifolium]